MPARDDPVWQVRQRCNASPWLCQIGAVREYVTGYLHDPFAFAPFPVHTVVVTIVGRRDRVLVQDVTWTGGRWCLVQEAA